MAETEIQASSNPFVLPGRRLRDWRSWAWELFCFAAFLGIIASQVFFPPLVGLSDNNDFPKVFGPAHICKAPPENLNTYFVSGYRAGPQCEWPSGFVSSEILLVRTARWLARPFTGREWFDLRASAAVHLALLASAMALFLCCTRAAGAAVRFTLPIVATLMFSDVAYVSYLNSGYMDAVSWVSFLLLAATAATAILRNAWQWTVPLYVASGLFLVCSKAQHAILAIPFTALAAWLAWRTREPMQRMLWLASAMVLVIAGALIPALTPPEYENISLYNVVFTRLAPADREVLNDLGLDARYQELIGTNAFSPNSPLRDPDWAREFASHVSFLDIAAFYLRHPAVAWREIDRELRDSVHSMRPDYMANYRREDGFPPHSVATEFGWWSSVKTALMTRYPYALVGLFGLSLIVGILRRPALLAVGLAVGASAVAEFLICTLADAIDTHRHLFLFHVITDALLLLCVGWMLHRVTIAVSG